MSCSCRPAFPVAMLWSARRSLGRLPRGATSFSSTSVAIAASAKLRHASERLRAYDGRAVHQPPLGQGIIADREMHRAGIVPHHQIADPPAMPIAKFGPHAMRDLVMW